MLKITFKIRQLLNIIVAGDIVVYKDHQERIFVVNSNSIRSFSDWNGKVSKEREVEVFSRDEEHIHCFTKSDTLFSPNCFKIIGNWKYN